MLVLVLVLISVKTGLYLGPWAHVAINLRAEMALCDNFFTVAVVCACSTAWGIGDLHQAAAVEEGPCPSVVGSMSPGAVDLVEEKAFDRFRRLISVEAAVFDSGLLCHRVGQFLDVIRQFSKIPTTGPINLPPWPFPQFPCRPCPCQESFFRFEC